MVMDHISIALYVDCKEEMHGCRLGGRIEMTEQCCHLKRILFGVERHNNAKWLIFLVSKTETNTQF